MKKSRFQISCDCGIAAVLLVYWLYLVLNALPHFLKVDGNSPLTFNILIQGTAYIFTGIGYPLIICMIIRGFRK